MGVGGIFWMQVDMGGLKWAWADSQLAGLEVDGSALRRRLIALGSY